MNNGVSKTIYIETTPAVEGDAKRPIAFPIEASAALIEQIEGLGRLAVEQKLWQAVVENPAASKPGVTTLLHVYPDNDFYFSFCGANATDTETHVVGIELLRAKLKTDSPLELLARNDMEPDTPELQIALLAEILNSKIYDPAHIDGLLDLVTHLENDAPEIDTPHQ